MNKYQPEIPSEVLALEVFAERLQKFCTKNAISNRQLSNFLGNTQFASKTSCWRLLNGTIAGKYYLQFLAPLETALELFLTNKGANDEQIETALNHLFPYRSTREMITARCELSAEAVKFFGLSDDPFDVDKVLKNEEFFNTKEIETLCNRVKDAVLFQRFVCVTGQVGSGKTAVKIRVARELADNENYQVRLLYPEFFDMNSVTVNSIAQYILEEFEIKAGSKTAKIRKIKELLTSLSGDQTKVALVFDECHRLNDKVITSLKNFWEMTNGGFNRLLGIVLFGQPKFVDSTLRDWRFREIAERVKVLEMPKLDKSAAEYLRHKIALVGGDSDALFEPSALAKICRIAKTPLALGNLANHSLMTAFEKFDENRVSAAMIQIPDVAEVKSIRRAA